MSALAAGGVVFACVFGAALLGLGLRRILPEPHLSQDSRTTITLGMGLLATMAALVLGLLIASAKSSYDTQTTELTQLAAGVILLDRMLAHYGPDTGDARVDLRRAVARIIEQTWPGHDPARRPELNPRAVTGEGLYDKIQALSPRSDDQRLLRADALRLAADLARTRWLIFAQVGSSIPMPFVAILIFWVAVIFLSFGLFAPPNTTVVTALFICAVSVSGAIFLILELDESFRGLIQISSRPLRMALDNLGR